MAITSILYNECLRRRCITKKGNVAQVEFYAIHYATYQQLAPRLLGHVRLLQGHLATLVEEHKVLSLASDQIVARNDLRVKTPIHTTNTANQTKSSRLV